MLPPTATPVLPPPPSLARPPSRTSQRSNSFNNRGFRLLEDAANDIETSSVYSIYKQKIDKMFEPDPEGNPGNSVQARIERMFTEVVHEEGIKSDLGCHCFSIDYLGSVQLNEKVSSLSGLQIPLKDLYFGYKKCFKLKKGLTGKLEINSAGLKVKYQGEKGDLDQLNPFPTIAVWSAVKFVLHTHPKPSFAFLPLITDPDNIDKQTLFQTLDQIDSKYILNQSHAPIFTVVMRKIGLQKQLECHAFICQTSEDAIVIAATLYKSLMSHMKNKSHKPKNKNGLSCMSVSSSTFADSITNPVPVRPPRKKRSTTSSTISDDTLLNTSIKKSTKLKKAPSVPQSSIGSTHRPLGPTRGSFGPPRGDNSLSRESLCSPRGSQSSPRGDLSPPRGAIEPIRHNNPTSSPKRTIGSSSGSSEPIGHTSNHRDQISEPMFRTQGPITGSLLGESNSECWGPKRDNKRCNLLSKGPIRDNINPSGPISIEDMDEIRPYEEPASLCPTETSNSMSNTSNTMSNTSNTLSNKMSNKVSNKMPNMSNKTSNKMCKTSTHDEILVRQSPPGFNNEVGDLKRTRSVRRRSQEDIMVQSGDQNVQNGDILTKVTIPRSGSFLNTGGLTRYKSKANRNGLTSGGSPLGFSELFAEFRVQENLHSLDEILAAIVRPDGMSFNALKPIYKEFLLKLAVTFTADELYHRAQVIMRRQRRGERRNRRRRVGVERHRLKRVFRKSFRLNLWKKLRKKKIKNLKKFETKSASNLPESSISTSSYDTHQFQPKELTLQRKQSYRKRNSDIKEANQRLRRDRMSTSEDSDFFTMKRRKEKTSPSNQNRNSSSGYVSCSECSYDSDTCTCVSADKCYCSLGNRFNQNKTRPSDRVVHQRLQRPQTASTCRSCKTNDDRCYCSLGNQAQTADYCGCETDTCTQSDKCYCQEIQKKESSKKSKKGLKKHNKFDPKNRIFEELQRKGFFSINEEKINHNPNMKNPKKYKKNTQKLRQCNEQYCYCPDGFCSTNIEIPLPSNQTPNKSYLHGNKPRPLDRIPNNNNSYDPITSNCQDCQSCQNNGGTIFEQLQRRGFIPSCEEMTTPPNERKLCKKNSTTKSTKSVEYLCNPNEKYYEKLKNKYYEDFEITNSHNHDVRRRSLSENNLMETQMYSRELYGRAMSEATPRNGFIQNSVRSFKSFNGNQHRSTQGKTLQKSIAPTSSTEALSVKKSAEIAALFTDLKLSQTTDITHILPMNFNSPNFHQFPINSSQSQIRPRQFHIPNSHTNDKKAIVTPYKHISSSGKMIQNTLYQRGMQSSGKNGLYSARNGLYTIQSQSDSSCSENRTDGVKKNSSFENTLGYLP